MRVKIRAARPEDISLIMVCIAEHAAYERAPFDEQGKAEKLASFLFAVQPRFHCLVAEGQDGEILGYATVMEEFSTWDAALYLHMDCLYLKAHARSSGIGRQFMREIARLAQSLNCTMMQWQTPVFNEGAIRFYYRLGATSREKLRMYLDEPTISRIADEQ